MLKAPAGPPVEGTSRGADSTPLSDVRRSACDHLLHHCGSLVSGEALVVVHDAATAEVAALLAERARLTTERVRRFEIPKFDRHGQEPADEVSDAMSRADLVAGVTGLSMAHTRARQRASHAGARYLSLADYSLDLLEHASVRADFRARGPVARAVADRFTSGRNARVTTRSGTDLSLAIADRTGNCCPGYVEAPGELGSPPDIEANVSPVESASKGVVVVDGSVPYPGIGLLDAPITLFVEGGRIVRFEGEASVVEKLESIFRGIASPNAYVLAECGVGLNPEAELTGSMLTDEGTNGTMHFGFGSNSTVGGKNEVSFHLDFVFCDASLEVDGAPVLENGEVVV
jgi:2,5-dihydroxypyridine 5,6-dioxygenase